MTRWVRRWWRQPDRFDWISAYLVDQRLQYLARLCIAGVTAAFALVAAAMLASAAGPHEPWPRAIGATAGIVGALLAVSWLAAWPTRNQSRLYVVVANACIAAACLAQSDPLAGLTGCYSFVVLGAYAALMHRAKATSYTIVVSLSVAGILAWRIVDRGGGDIVLALSELAILALFSVGTPVVLNTLLHIMANDIAQSDHDALTGLLNRRGFYRHTRRLIDRHADTTASHLAVTMIDLDNFKRINDRYGHAAGDKALIDVGDALRRMASATAVVARAGGEEFLIAEVSDSDKPSAARLCHAIADIPHAVTASAGTTSVPVSRINHTNRSSLIDQLVTHADTAMYAAKSAGGNQHHHHRGPPL